MKKELDAAPSSELEAFVRDLPEARPEEPLPVAEHAVRVVAKLVYPAAAPSRRALRVLGALAAAAVILPLILMATLQPWRRTDAQPAPPTPEQRIALIERLRAEESRATTPTQRQRIARQRTDQCIALAEEAWKARYGPGEERWIGRLRRIRRVRREPQRRLAPASTRTGHGRAQSGGVPRQK